MSSEICVLHVDDDRSFGQLVADFFAHTAADIRVLTETSAGAGLERLHEADDIDCIVSDYDMPGRNGIEFLDAVRDEFPDLPFILCTGKGSEEVASEAISKGATDYLQKGGGSEQYELLANRVRNAVEQYRSQHRAEEHERITRVIRDLNRALVYADSVDEIEHEVCTVLSDADPYVTACIAGVDPDTMRVEPRTWAGDDAGYFEELAMYVDEESPGRHAPGGVAYHDRMIAISQNIPEDSEYAPWQEAAVTRGFLSLIVVPLAYNGDLYGLLAVFADRSFAFDDTEKSLFRELGDDIAHAMHAKEMRTELQTTASRLEALFERSPDMINVHDTDGTVIRSNPQLCQQTGYTEDQLVGMKVWDFDRNLDPAAAHSLWDGMDAGDSLRVESEYQRTDGSTFPVEVHIRRLNIGGEDRFVAISRDITERKQHEQELQRTERRFRAILEDPNILAGVLDTDGTLLSQNKTALQYIDAGLGDVEGEPFWETPWWPAEMRPTIKDNIERAAAGEYVEYEADLTKPDGERYSVEGVIRPVTDDAGAVVSLIVSARDVTDRTVREKRLEAILEDTTAPLFMKDRDGEYLLVNEGFKQLFGLADVTVRGQTDAELLSPAVADAVRENDREVLRTGEPIEREEQITVEGEQRTFLSSKTPVYDIGTESDPADPVAVLGVATDITEQKQREQRLKRQNERFDELASVVSHDLQTPLATARGRAELAVETGDTEQMAQALNAIERVDRLREGLVTTLRTKEIVSETDVVDVERIGRDIWTTIQPSDAATLEVSDTPTVEADPAALRRLLENLFSNAVEHGSEAVTVRFGAIDGGFFVEDDGPGIPEQERENVFTPGYSTKRGGTGVGLASVRQIVVAHDWEIRITDGTAGGARFEITRTDVDSESSS
jgi:PAS domain S-box-containing protein